MAPQPTAHGNLKIKSVTIEEPGEVLEETTDGYHEKAKAWEIVAQGKKRREQKRAHLAKNHAGRVKDVSGRINKLFAERNKKITRLQKSQWEALAILNDKRDKLEAQILLSMQSIQSKTLNTAAELHAMIVGKVENLKRIQVVDSPPE